jgi:hypothetical protein
LNKAKPEHYEILLENFSHQGVPDWLIAEMRLKPPRTFIPTHLFQVLHVGVGRASGAVPFNLESVNNCMIRWGEVKQIHDNHAEVSLYSLEKTKSSYNVKPKQESVQFSPEIIPGLKIGDIVAVHWNLAIKILSSDEVARLSYWTDTVIHSL